MAHSDNLHQHWPSLLSIQVVYLGCLPNNKRELCSRWIVGRWAALFKYLNSKWNKAVIWHTDENLMIPLESSFMFKLERLYYFISKLEMTLTVWQWNYPRRKEYSFLFDFFGMLYRSFFFSLAVGDGQKTFSNTDWTAKVIGFVISKPEIQYQPPFFSVRQKMPRNIRDSFSRNFKSQSELQCFTNSSQDQTEDTAEERGYQKREKERKIDFQSILWVYPRTVR